MKQPLSSTWQNVAFGLDMMLHVWNGRQPSQDLGPCICLKTILIILEPLFYSINRSLHIIKQCPETLVILLSFKAHSFGIKLSIPLILSIHKDSVLLSP